jgi:hypothetical protein
MEQNLLKPGPKQPHSANWKPGTSGNPNGRPPGIVDARHRFTAAFLNDLSDAWRANGPDVMARVAKLQPESFFATCARLLPKDVALTIETQLPGGLTPDDIVILRAIKEAIPNAGERSPQEVLEYVRDTLRAAEAKVISD